MISRGRERESNGRCIRENKEKVREEEVEEVKGKGSWDVRGGECLEGRIADKRRGSEGREEWGSRRE